MNMKQKLVMAVATLFAFAASAANAALPQGALDAFTQLAADGQAIIDQAWPIATLITVGFILLALFKKGAKKAAS